MGTRRLIALFLLAVGLGIGGLYLATKEAVLSPSTYALEDPNWLLVAVAVVSGFATWAAPVAKIRLLAAAQRIRLSVGEAFLGHVGQVFGTAMTPSGTGGGPAMMLAFERMGIKVGTGLGIAIQLFVLDLAALGVLIPVGLVYLLLFSSIELPRATSVLGGLLAIVALVGAVVLARYPRLLYAAVRWLSKRRFLQRFSERLARVARDYYVSAIAFRNMRPSAWWQLQVVNMIAWFGNFVMFWALLELYGASARLLDVVSVLSIVTLISFFVPTPGASGFSELMVGLAVGATDTAQTIAAPVALWRAATFYVVYLLGPVCAWILLSRTRSAWTERRNSVPKRGAQEKGSD